MSKKNNNNKKLKENTPNSIQRVSTYDKYIKGKEIYYLLGLTFIACYLIFKDYIFLRKVYLFRDIGSDSINIYFPWLAGTSDYLSNESSMGWSFAQGMGQNLFPLSLGDFFSNFITYFDKSQIPYLLVFAEIIKIFLAGFVFYKFLQELKLSNYASLLFAFLYSFSGFIILGGCWTIFSLEALYAAIILYGFERWLNHKKIIWFVVGIALMAFLQPFFLFMYSVFLAAYAIVRYNDIYEFELKPFFVFSIKTAGLLLLGVLLSSYQLFADLLQYTESPRVGGEASLFARLMAHPVFGLADEVLRFTTVFRSFGSDILGTGSNFRGWQNYLEAPDFYCGILSLLTFPQFFISLDKKRKYIFGALALLFTIPIFFPYFRYAFWAFTGDYFRTFSLIIVLLLLLFSSRAIDYIEKKGEINIVVLGITILVLLLLLYTPDKKYALAVNKSYRSIVTFLIFLYGALLFGISKKNATRDIVKFVLLFACFTEAIYFSSVTVNKRDVITKTILNSKVGYNDYTVDAVNYLKQTDKTFYRINKDYSSGLAIHMSMNDAKVQGYYGTQSYFSFNQKNYIRFLGDLNIINPSDENSTRWAKGLVDRPILQSLTSGKYWITKRTDNALTQLGFDSINKFGDVTVYKNKFALPFGVSYNKIIPFKDFKRLSPIQKDFCLLRACVVDSADWQVFSSFEPFNLSDTLTPLTTDNYMAYKNSLQKESFAITHFSENNILGNINTVKSAILFFSIPFDEGWHATINGEEAKLYRVNCGLTGVLTKAGNNTVELKFVPRYKKEGALVSIVSLLLFIGLVGFVQMKKSSQSK